MRKGISGALLDLVYPMSLYCISCGKIIDDSRTYRLCNECMAASNWITERHCSVCGKPLAETDPGERCFACAEFEAKGLPHSFDKGYSCAGYGAVEQSLIFALKYGSRSDIADTLGEIMYDRMVSEHEADELAASYDLVVPVPVYSERKARRGFNHAGLMARSFAERAGIACEPELIIRTRATAPMKGLGPEERWANVKGAFSIRERKRSLVEGARILVIDDIYTTGATLDEIASILKDAGARRVDFLAYAGGSDMISSAGA